MHLWILSYFSLFLGLLEVRPLWVRFHVFLEQNQAVLALRAAAAHLRFLQEMLETGLVPDSKEWDAILKFPSPWGRVLHQSLRELRNQGAPVLPSLQRMQGSLQDQAELILEAKTKTAQSFGQALTGLVLVPVFSFILYEVMPGVKESGKCFILIVLFCTLLSSLSFIWMIAMAENARYGNLPSEKRHWFISVNATLERVFALISSGSPADLAWRRAIEELSLQDRSLAEQWRGQVWDLEVTESLPVLNECERLMVGVGKEVRKSIQTSLIEGRPCLNRLESIHRSFRIDLRNKINRELSLLPNRSLKPLFVFVLPSILILMASALWFAFEGATL